MGYPKTEHISILYIAWDNVMMQMRRGIAMKTNALIRTLTQDAGGIKVREYLSQSDQQELDFQASDVFLERGDFVLKPLGILKHFCQVTFLSDL